MTLHDFLHDGSHVRSIPIALTPCSSYGEFSSAIIEKLVVGAGFVTDSLHGRTLLLKPNLVSGKAQSWGCTHPLFVREVARYFLDCGAKVLVGDSPAFGSALSVAKAHGLTDALADLGVPLISFQQKVLRTLSTGHTITLAGEALECDYFVNLPKVKAHGQMRLSLAVKNCFGLVLGARKALLHMKEGGGDGDFIDIILALQNELPPGLCLVDGIEAMHYSGPIMGRKLDLGLVGASASHLALDLALHACLQVALKDSPLMARAMEKGLPGTQTMEHSFPLDVPNIWHGIDFMVPDLLSPIRFDTLRFIKSTVKRMALKIK